jgi:L-threonylcarbamoyladenylate synthase
VSAHPQVIALCEAFGGPIVSTSANLTGQPAVSTQAALDPALLARLDGLLPGATSGLDRPSVIRDALTGQVLRG